MGTGLRVSFKFLKLGICFLTAFIIPAFSIAIDDQAASSENIPIKAANRQAVVLDVQGPIGPATAEYLINALEKSTELNAELVIIRMDTPRFTPI